MRPRKVIGMAVLIIAAFFILVGLLIDPYGTLAFLFILGVLVAVSSLGAYLFIALVEDDWFFWRNV